MKTTVDAFGTEVIVGDTVVFFTNGWYSKNHGDLQKGEVIKCTSHGATVSFGNQKVNIRSGRIYRINNDYNSLILDCIRMNKICSMNSIGLTAIKCYSEDPMDSRDYN